MRRSLMVSSLIIIVIGIIAASFLLITKTEKTVKIIDILRNPEKFSGKKVIVVGYYYGWSAPKNLTGPPIGGPPKTRSDWIVADDTGWIYVEASIGINLTYGDQIKLVAVVQIENINGVDDPYLHPLRVEKL